MIIHRSLCLSTPRRNILAACLAAALAAGGAGAAGPHPSADTLRKNAGSDEAIFAALHTTEANGAWTRPRDASLWPALDLPTHPAGTITVTSCEDDGPGSLREAFALAQGGDTIDLSTLTCPSSTITLTTGAIVATVPNLSVLGPGRDVLAVDVDATNPSRAFVVDDGLSISDLTISHGRTTNGVGGCIRVIQGGLTLTRSTVTGCQAGDGSNAKSWGAGVDVIGNLYMQSSTISASTAMASDAAYGGGAFVSGKAYLYDSTIEGSTAIAATGEARGGGLYSLGSVVVARSSHVLNNSVDSTDGTAFGGGVFSANIVQVFTSTISGNTAYSQNKWSYGGGLHGDIEVVLSAGTLSGNTASSNCVGCYSMGGGASALGKINADYSTISDNHVASSAAAAGGGLATRASGNSGRIFVANSTVSGNSASGGGGYGGYGGGIAARQASPFTAKNSTIAFNQASHFGGGAVGNVNGPSVPILLSTVVANNEAPVGVNDDLAPGQPFTAFEVLGNNNLVMSVSGGITFANDPLHVDPLLQVLQNNGGPTQTHALDPLSPAIDGGSNSESFLYDQRGCPFARESGGAADIGAFELQVEPADHVFGDGFDGVPVCP